MRSHRFPVFFLTDPVIAQQQFICGHVEAIFLLEMSRHELRNVVRVSQQTLNPLSLVFCERETTFGFHLTAIHHSPFNEPVQNARTLCRNEMAGEDVVGRLDAFTGAAHASANATQLNIVLFEGMSRRVNPASD